MLTRHNMKDKKGFTLIELVVSIVLVSIILVTLMGSLIQLRKAYRVVHENTDIIVYTSSVSRAINSDLNENNGIRYVSCEPNGKMCTLILGNDARRELIITDNDKVIDDTEGSVEHSNNKTTLKYVDTTKYDKTNNEDDKKLIYIRTLELNKYENSETKVTTSDGYNFYDMSASQYEYSSETDNNIDAFTTITIRLLDGINMDVSNYNIVLYGAGRYDYSKYVGKAYKIDLNNDNATTSGTASIDQVFGVSYYKAGSQHKKRDEISKIEIPTKDDLAFLGYYYKPYGVTTGTQIIDAGGNIIANSRLFKNDVLLNDTTTGEVKAKWGACEAGFKLQDGKCIQETYTVTLNKNTSGKTCSSVGESTYTVKFQNLVKNVTIPQCEGYTFEGYVDDANKLFHNRNGQGVQYYDKPNNATFRANWHACAAGQYSSLTSQSCTDCARGSYTSSVGSGACTACQNGKTTSGAKSTSCNADCPNNSNVATWANATWNNNNTITNNCKIATCKTGYHLESNNCTKNNYNIAYNLYYGGHGTNHPTTAKYGENVTISNPKKVGYEFTGWTFNGNTSTAIHGSTIWSNQSTKVKDTTFKNLTPTDEATVTLTANWSECAEGYYNDGTTSTCAKCPIGYHSIGRGNTSCKKGNIAKDCSNNVLKNTVPSNATGLYKIMAEQAFLDNAQSEFITSCEGVDFTAISSDTNGKGVYELAFTKDDPYPIYYYRGEVTNNNVKFAGFCWRAVRTTNTGGVKLIYNGSPDASGHCTNTTGKSTQIKESAFNSSSNSPAYVGYMYGTKDGTRDEEPYISYEKSVYAEIANYKFGEGVTYSNGTYTLTKTIPVNSSNFREPSLFNNNHYTCFSESETCTTVYYVHYMNREPYSDTFADYYYIKITGVDPNGRELIDVVFETFFRNDRDSTAKIEIENWYETEMKSYTSKIEDTVYCDDRTISSYGAWSSTGSMTDRITFRENSTVTSFLICERELDRFTVSSSIGNGKLKYPVGLLTTNEMILAGGKINGANSTYYLNTNEIYWVNHPRSFGNNTAYESGMYTGGHIANFSVNTPVFGLRPVISISKNTTVTGGNGTANDPYTIA